MSPTIPRTFKLSIAESLVLISWALIIRFYFRDNVSLFVGAVIVAFLALILSAITDPTLPRAGARARARPREEEIYWELKALNRRGVDQPKGKIPGQVVI